MSNPEKSGGTKVAGCLVIALILLVMMGALAALAWYMNREEVPRQTILEVDIEQALVEYVPEDPIASLLMEDQMRLRDFTEALQAAAEDDSVVALVARVAPVGMGMANIDEMRDAILAFRESGKPAIAYSDTFGEVLPANGSYYLASAFDEVYIQPSGDVGLTGIGLQSPFIAGTLEKIGVKAEWSTRHEYKTAGNMFMNQEYTEPEREALEALVDSIFERMVSTIAQAREIPTDRLLTLIDNGPILGPTAEAEGLVDGLLYRDEVYDRVRELAGAGDGDDSSDGDDAALLYLSKYWGRTDSPYAKGDHTIGVVYAIGTVQRGDSDYDPFGGSYTMGSDSVSAALRAAIDDDDVEAIILRVDSPGGSYVASDSIWREVERAQAEGKPVIASMGNLAASGGYFVSMGADKIVAHPSTITGSIGVLGGKFATRDLWNKMGITFDSVRRGDHADMWSGVDGFDESEWAKLNEWLDRVYEDFTTKAATGRDLPLAELQEVAKGRVWSGIDAKDRRLVDELGGYATAIRLAREAAAIDADASVRLKDFPRHQEPFEALFGEGPDNSQEAVMRAILGLSVDYLRPLAQMAHRAGLIEPRGTLEMRPLEATAP